LDRQNTSWLVAQILQNRAPRICPIEWGRAANKRPADGSPGYRNTICPSLDAKIAVTCPAARGPPFRLRYDFPLSHSSLQNSRRRPDRLQTNLHLLEQAIAQAISGARKIDTHHRGRQLWRLASPALDHGATAAFSSHPLPTARSKPGTPRNRNDLAGEIGPSWGASQRASDSTYRRRSRTKIYDRWSRGTARRDKGTEARQARWPVPSIRRGWQPRLNTTSHTRPERLVDTSQNIGVPPISAAVLLEVFGSPIKYQRRHRVNIPGKHHCSRAQRLERMFGKPG